MELPESQLSVFLNVQKRKCGTINCRTSSISVCHSNICQIGQTLNTVSQKKSRVNSTGVDVGRLDEELMMMMEECPAVRMEGVGAATSGFANLIGTQFSVSGKVRGVAGGLLQGAWCPLAPTRWERRRG